MNAAVWLIDPRCDPPYNLLRAKYGVSILIRGVVVATLLRQGGYHLYGVTLTEAWRALAMALLTHRRF